MPRISLCVRYDGSAYHGWQTQIGLATVQATVERALSFVANHPVKTFCAGRTDAGVHATAQIIHFDTDAERSEHAWVFGANSNLPADITVVWARLVDNSFHARFSATARCYRYVIYNEPIRPALLRHAVGWWYQPLDEQRMQHAANHLLGEHNFSAFRGAGCQSHSPMRNLQQLDVYRSRNLVVLEIKANAFLLHMVRNITGVLVAIGGGQYKSEWALEVLQSLSRCAAGITMSPCGLYLVKVDYPANFNLPEINIGPFFLR